MRDRPRLRSAAMIPGLCTLIVGGAAIYGATRFGSLTTALAFARGERLVIEDRERDLGAQPFDSHHALRVPIRNLGSRPVHILGASVSCSCATVVKKPKTIAPGESGSIAIDFHVNRAGQVASRVSVFTDDPDTREVTFVVGARGIEPPRDLESASPPTVQPLAPLSRLLPR